MLPDEIGGVVLKNYSVTPDQFVGGANREAFATFLATVDRPREGVTLAVAADPSGSIAGQVRALKVAGAQSADLLSALLADKAYADAVVSTSSLGGRDVTVIAVQVDGRTLVDYVYVVGDVALLVTGADAQTAARVLAVLP